MACVGTQAVLAILVNKVTIEEHLPTKIKTATADSGHKSPAEAL